MVYEFNHEQILNSRLIDKFVIQGRTIVVSYNNDVLKSLQVKFAFVRIIDEYNYMITVDDTFMKCSNETKNFIIEHEIGHIMLHMNNKIGLTEKIKRFFNCLFEINSYEFEADSYACRKVGKECAINAFKEIIKIKNSKLMVNRFNRLLELEGVNIWSQKMEES